MTDLSIESLMRSGVPLPRHSASAVARAVAQQLASAHDQGSTHGDVGPHTVFMTLTDDRSEVAGAILVAPRPAQRPTNWPAAPEQGVGVAAPPEDVYALGELMRALHAYAAGDGSAPLIVSAMTREDPARRPSLHEVLDAVDPVSEQPTFVEQPTLVEQDWVPSTLGAAPEPVAQSLPAEMPPPHPAPETTSRRTPIVLGLVGALLVAAVAGGTYWWLNQPDEPAASLVSGTREDLPGPGGEDDTALGDTVLSTAEEPTEQAGAQTQPVDPPAEDPAPADPAAEDPAPADPAPADPPAADPPAADPPAADPPARDLPGTDAAAFDAAYCRARGTFVALADTDSFRTIICERFGSLTYHGLNRADGLTITTPAVETASGWKGTSEGGGVYEVSSTRVRVLQGGTELASEPVHTFVDSSDVGTFRPGDLDLSEQISYPECDGAGVVVIASFVGGDPAAQVQASLDAHPGSDYLRTDLSCDNFNRPSGATGGADIYATYYWVGYDRDAVCDAARAAGSYAYWLQDGVESGDTIDCS